MNRLLLSLLSIALLVGCGGSGGGAPTVHEMLAVGIVGGSSAICRLNSDGSSRVLYTFPEGETCYHISPAADSGEIGFLVADSLFNNAIGKISADGAIRTDFPLGAGIWADSLALSPDGQRVAIYSDDRSGSPTIRIGDASQAPANFDPPLYANGYPDVAWLLAFFSSNVAFDQVNGGDSYRTEIVDTNDPGHFSVVRVGRVLGRTFRPHTQTWTWIEFADLYHLKLATGDYTSGATTVDASTIVTGTFSDVASPIAFPEDHRAFLVGYSTSIVGDDYQSDLYEVPLLGGKLRKIPTPGITQIRQIAYLP